jgi:formate/nitrite transporter FocA (FNT family)
MEHSKIIELLQAIRANQEKEIAFEPGKLLTGAFAGALILILAFALNDAFKKTFELIKVRGNPLLGLWIYALICGFIVIVLLYLLYKYLGPVLHKWFDPKR